MSDKGYIKLDRALNNWRYKKKPNYIALWVHILINANHENRKVYDVEVERGSMLTSYEKLANECGLSVQTVRTILKHLNGEELTIKSTNKNTLISVIKYDDYQGANKQTNKQANKQLTNNQQTTNNKQYIKDIINIKEIYKGHSQEFIDAFEKYRDYRKQTKSPLTDYGCELALKKLGGMGDESMQIAIIEQSIREGWKGLFELKDKPKEEPKRKSYEEQAKEWMNY